MEVRDVFELRKQGKIEEAYQAIVPIYANHKGHYTTIAMFWVGVDMMRLRYQQRRLAEAYKIFQSLLRLYPTMDDKDHRGQATMLRAALFVFDHNTTFSMLTFITQWGIEKLDEEDWKSGQSNGHPTPSLGLRIVGKVFKELNDKPTIDMALQVAPILAEAIKHCPYNMNVQRYKAIIYTIMGKKQRATAIYCQLLKKHRQSYLYLELSRLVNEDNVKIALLTRAITTQREEKFRQRTRFTLAEMLYSVDKARARYELDHCIAARKQAGFTITWDMQNLVERLQDVSPVTDIDQKSFYHQQEMVVTQFINNFVYPNT